MRLSFSPSFLSIYVMGCLFLAIFGTADLRAEPSHGIAMHGAPALGADFTHLPYANPSASKGGRVVFGVLGTFDTLNPFTVRGISAQGIAPPLGLVYQSLMVRSADEPFSLYGSLAQSVEIPDDRSSVTFHLDPRARFSDGKPVTADDVLFTWSLLKEKGKPNVRGYYSKVVSAKSTDPMTLVFDLSGANDRELPLILALMPILPKHLIDPQKFEETTLSSPVGSGPYIVSEVKPGESITYRRNPDFWGTDLPVNKGLYNVDEYRFDYYRDANTLFEAFKGGLYDIRSEDNSTRWVTGYDFPAALDGRIVKDPIKVNTPKGMTGLVFNSRRPLFADIKVREAFGYLFDFEWVNNTLFDGVYARTNSYFEGSDLASTGHMPSPREISLMAPFQNTIRPEFLSGEWRAPKSDGSGRDRTAAKKAIELLKSAGWTLSQGGLKNSDGKNFEFEILVVTRVQERLALNFSESLKRLGITMNVRFLDDVQYWRRVGTFDFDMIQFTWGSSPSPGNEQYNRWGTKSREIGRAHV